MPATRLATTRITSPLSLFWKITLIPLICVELLAVFGVLDVQVTYTTFGLLLTSAAVFATIEIIHALTRDHHSMRLQWWSIVPAVLATYIDAGGDLLHWYSDYQHFDAGLHMFGTFAATAFVWNIILIFLHQKADRRVLLWATCATGIALGVLYEMEEYLEDMLTTSNRLGDGPDTGNDLTMDALGAVLLTLIVIWNWRKQRRHSGDQHSRHTSSRE